MKQLLAIPCVFALAAMLGCGTSNSQPTQNTSPSVNVAPKSDSPPVNHKEPTVTVYLNPLMMLLVGAERQKGSPLTESEVLAVRDSAVSVPMTPTQAEKFYKSLDSEVPVHRMNPDRIWEEWQEIRDKIE